MENPDHNKYIVCPACGSDDIRVIPDDERMASAGLYSIHDFIGQLYEDQTLECNRCLYQFSINPPA